MQARVCLAVVSSALACSPVWAGFESAGSSPVPGAESSSPRPWDLSIRASIGRNDNVQLVPDSTSYVGSTAANYFALQANGAYRFYQSGNLSAGASLSVSSLWNEDKQQTPTSKFSDYNFYTLNPAVYITYKLNVGGMPASITGSYDLRREDGHSEDLAALGLTSHTLKVSGNLYPRQDLKLTATLTRGWDNFEVKFPTPDRDADRLALDLGLRKSFSNGLHNISVGVGYIDNDAKGSNFAYDGYNTRLRFETGVLRPVWLAAEVKHGNLDYVGGSVRPSQKVTISTVQALWPIDKNWRADVFYSREDYASNSSSFEADANVFGVGLTYIF